MSNRITMNTGTRVALLGGVCLLAMTSIPAMAQSAADQTESVTVTGIISSLQKNLDIKRDSLGLVDAISATDVGKFPDVDIAAALQLYQRNRIDRTARIVLQSSENRRRFHLGSEAAIRAEFAKANEGADRNKWLYSYNPMTVPLV